MSFSSIVIAGGSLRIISFLGCLRYLEEHDMLRFVRNCVGSSAGALLCFCIALKYTSSEARDFLKSHLCGASGGIADCTAEDVFNLFSQYGVDRGNKLSKFIGDILFEKTGKRDITFMDLAKDHGMNLVVCVTNLSKERHEYLCVDNTPELSVVTALRVTCSIPFVFTPVTINGDVFLDGGLLNNFPLDYFHADRQHDILGFNIKSANYQKTDNFMQYFCFVVNCMMEKFGSNAIMNCPTQNVLTLEFDGDTCMSMLSTAVSEGVIDEYMRNGYAAIAGREPFFAKRK